MWTQLAEPFLVTRGGWLLVAVLSTTGCATIASQASSLPAETPCSPSPAVVGTWTDARLTQLGPALVRLTVACDCRYEWRAQLLFGRITTVGDYRTSGQVLQFAGQKATLRVPYTVEHGQLHLEEFPGERHVYSRRGPRPSCAGTRTAAPTSAPR